MNELKVIINTTRSDDIIQRIVDKCVRTSDRYDGSSCWIWTGANNGKPKVGKSGHSYGKISINGHMSLVHRVMYVCVYGYIPNKIQVDHKCNNRLCCNPAHLEAVQHKVNCKRRDRRLKDKK